MQLDEQIAKNDAAQSRLYISVTYTVFVVYRQSFSSLNMGKRLYKVFLECRNKVIHSFLHLLPPYIFPLYDIRCRAQVLNGAISENPLFHSSFFLFYSNVSARFTLERVCDLRYLLRLEAS